MAERQSAVSDQSIFDLWMSQYRLPVVQLALGLGLFDTLNEGPKSCDQLAHKHGLHTETLASFLQVLRCENLLSVSQSNDDGGERLPLWSLTQSAREFLVSSHPFFWGPMLCDNFGLSCNSLRNLLRTGLPQWDVVDSWDRGESTDPLDSSRALQVMCGMHAHSACAARHVPWGQVFSSQPLIMARVLDVAAGSGIYSIEMARQFGVKCTLMELGCSAELVQRHFIEPLPETLRDRLSVHQGDMFDDAQWPTSRFDAVFMSEIFHDWNDAQCIQLATSAHRRASTLVLNEILLPHSDQAQIHPSTASFREGEDDEDAPSKFLTPYTFSLHMRLCTRGKQRSLAELRTLLNAAGFDRVSSIPNYMGHWSLVIAQSSTSLPKSSLSHGDA